MMFCNTCAKLKGFVLTVLLSLWMDSTAGITIQLKPHQPEIGKPVLLDVINIAGKIRSITWYKGLNPTSKNQILSFIPTLKPPETKGAAYFPQARGFENGSLLISDFKKIFEGDYTVQIQADLPQQASVSVNGVAPIVAPPSGLLLGVLLFSVFRLI
ncbi:cell adhesion molecule CEACAM3-like [Discoglossus pictus]